MNLTLLFCLLCFGYSCSFSLSKSKQISRREVHGQEENSTENDIYEVQDTLKFSYPKAEKPTLREIIYYHVIEKPYGGKGDGESGEIEDNGIGEDDIVDTERPFTNGHGFQFLPEPDQHDSSAGLEEEAVTKDIIEIYSAEEANEKDQEDKGSPEHETAITSHTSAEPVKKNYTNQSPAAKIISNTLLKQTSEENTPSGIEERTKEEIEDIEDVAEITTTPSIDAEVRVNKDEVVEEKKNTRAVFFTQAREKYQNRRAGKKERRRKRHDEAADIPEAPKLGPLNLDSLPEYAKKLISTPTPETTTGKVTLGRQPHSNEELQKELEEKIENIMATLKPELLEDSNSESDESNENEGHGKKRLARTYGMNLTEDRGHVWNDLLGDPGMFIEVGKPKENNEIAKHNELTDTPVVTPSITLYSAESKPIYMGNSNKEEDSNLESNSKDFDDIFVQVNTNKSNDTFAHSTEKDTDNNIDKQSEKLIQTLTIQDNHTESATESHESTTISSINDKMNTDSKKSSRNIENLKSYKKLTIVKGNDEEIVTETTTTGKTKPVDIKSGTKNNKHGNDKIGLSADSSNESDLENHKETIDEKERRAIVDITKTEILQELLKNDQFWEWLGDWTTTYTELLMKHIKNMVHDEVGRQLKTYTANLKKEIQKETKEALRLKEKSAKEVKDQTNDETNNKETPAAENPESSEDEEAKDKADKIIIDGMELPLTHNTNFEKSDDLLKRIKDKDIENHKQSLQNSKKPKNNDSKPQITVTAQNVYGNSAGSEKVTNIFVFYPQNDEIINDIKPFDDGNRENTFLIDKRKEDGATNLTAQKDESTSTTDKPSNELATETPVEIKNSNVIERPHTEKNKSDDSTQIILTESSKHIKESSNKEQQDIKETGDNTTEATRADESTSEANNGNNALVNNKSIDSKTNYTTTEHNEEITSENSVINNATENKEKGAVATEHSLINKNPASDPEKDSTKTEQAKADNAEQSSTAPVEKATENVIIENTEDPLKTSPEPETKEPLESFTKQSDGTERHTEETSNKI